MQEIEHGDANEKSAARGKPSSRLRGSRLIGPVHPDEHIEVTMRLRPRAAIPAKVRSEATIPLSHKSRRYLTDDEYYGQPRRVSGGYRQGRRIRPGT